MDHDISLNRYAPHNENFVLVAPVRGAGLVPAEGDHKGRPYKCAAWPVGAFQEQLTTDN